MRKYQLVRLVRSVRKTRFYRYASASGGEGREAGDMLIFSLDYADRETRAV